MKVNYHTFFGATVISFMVLLVAYFVSVRDLSIGADTANYAAIFYRYISGYSEFSFGYMYLALMSSVSFFSESHEVLFFAISVLVLGGSIFSLSRFFSESREIDRHFVFYSFILLSFVLVSPFFFASISNILRHGLSAPFLALFFKCFLERRYKISIVLACIAFGFHWSAIYYVVLAPLCFLRFRFLGAIIGMLSLLYLSGATQALLAPVAGFLGLNDFYDFVSGYGENSRYRAGVRMDFWFFSVAIIFVSYHLEKKMAGHVFFTKIMAVCFIPFLMIGYLPYSDRLLVFVWFFVPLVLTYGVGLVSRVSGYNLIVLLCFYFFLISCFYFISRFI